MYEGKVFIGLDGGKSGGISIVDSKQNILFCEPIPLIKLSKGNTYDINKIIEILDNCPNCLVGLEQAQAFFRDSKTGAFTTGELFGMMKGILIAKKIPFEIIPVKTWMKEMFKGMIIKQNSKPSVEYCLNKYPHFSFLATARCKKIHDGMTDSLCIALYTQMRSGNGT